MGKKQIRHFCDEKCQFKMKINIRSVKKDTCVLNIEMAKHFFDTYGVTTCEAGMGEKRAGKTKNKNTDIINEVKISCIREANKT